MIHVPPELLPIETQAIIQRVTHGFDGEVLPIESSVGVALIIAPYDGDDLDEAEKLISEGLSRLKALIQQEVPY